MGFKGGKPKPGRSGRKPSRPKGGVFLHKKGGKKGEKKRAAEAAAGGAAAPGGEPLPVDAGPATVQLAPTGAGGDDDDFAGMLGSMPDRAGDGSDSSGEGGGGGGEGGEQRAAKRRRKKGGQKVSAVEFEASRQLARQIADCSAEEQADWLWSSYQQHAQASALERGGLTGEAMAPLPTEGPLEARLKALRPLDWRQHFCGQGGHGGKQQQQQGARPPGSPSLLLVSASAIGAVGLIKHCPQFNRACRVAKLFAKHIKVGEQEEALRTQVACLGAGTPNRLCKLADGGALRLDRLAHVVLDVALDAKQRDILSVPETRADWWQLYDRHLKQRLAAGTLKLSLVNSDDLPPLSGGGS